MKKSVIVVGCLIAVQSFAALSLAKSPARNIDGAKVFKQYCSECHPGGGNRVKEKRPLAGSKQLGSLALFKSYLSAPPGHMPYFQSVVNDPKTLEALYDYCKKLPDAPVNSAQMPNTQTPFKG
jgi:mono/diheme cytochrome c family protein